jgi:RNA polymerase sigma factor (sigma-70 family)
MSHIKNNHNDAWLSAKISAVPDPRETTKLVRAATQGDQTAWDALVRQNAGLVWSIGRRFGLSPADNADVAQTVWLILVQNLGKLREPDYFTRWLVTITQRECLRLLNRRGREVPQDLSATLEDTADIVQPPVDHWLLARERDVKVRAAFEALPERCRELLRLLLRDPPPSYRDVAAQLQTSVGYIGPTRGRCLTLLRQSLDGDL